jgi:hypothetical protein
MTPLVYELLLGAVALVLCVAAVLIVFGGLR